MCVVTRFSKRSALCLSRNCALPSYLTRDHSYFENIHPCTPIPPRAIAGEGAALHAVARVPERAVSHQSDAWQAVYAGTLLARSNVTLATTDPTDRLRPVAPSSASSSRPSCRSCLTRSRWVTCLAASACRSAALSRAPCCPVTMLLVAAFCFCRSSFSKAWPRCSDRS